ncbi:MAG: hypothetical protein GF404_00445 [candidate division Zixibacteria bacterium]|jgi:hypothetical protein|nr:hypothetical protein [candidate division Zixibacteria bacterium]
MLFWSAFLFLLGVGAFLDSLFNYGDIFRRVNSVLFMLISLGLLIRTTTKMKLRRIEHFIERIEMLEYEIGVLRKRQRTKDPEPIEKTY